MTCSSWSSIGLLFRIQFTFIHHKELPHTNTSRTCFPWWMTGSCYVIPFFTLTFLAAHSLLSSPQKLPLDLTHFVEPLIFRILHFWHIKTQSFKIWVDLSDLPYNIIWFILQYYLIYLIILSSNTSIIKLLSSGMVNKDCSSTDWKLPFKAMYSVS